MGTSAQVASLRQQVTAARGEAAQARRELEIVQEYLSHADARIAALEAEIEQVGQLGNLMADAVVAAQHLTGMVPGQECANWPDLIPAHDQKVVSHEAYTALMTALYKLNCFVDGKQPIGADA